MSGADTRDALSAEARAAILAEVSRTPPRRYIDIAVDWLVTEETISRIARNEGIYRRRRARLTPAQHAQVLRDLQNPARRYRDIAADFQVTEESISGIANRAGIYRTGGRYRPTAEG